MMYPNSDTLPSYSLDKAAQNATPSHQVAIFQLGGWKVQCLCMAEPVHLRGRGKPLVSSGCTRHVRHKSMRPVCLDVGPTEATVLPAVEPHGFLSKLHEYLEMTRWSKPNPSRTSWFLAKNGFLGTALKKCMWRCPVCHVLSFISSQFHGAGCLGLLPLQQESLSSMKDRYQGCIYTYVITFV